MNAMPRRKFIKSSLFGGGALLAARFVRGSATEAKIEVLPDEPIATIRPELYGHFAEHIGGVIYDGIWVGPDSRVPNVDGIRKALVEHMRRLAPSVVRWPGGCFADSYDWRDGVGPRPGRPRRTNFWIVDDGLRRAPDGPQKYEPNEFGTDEFVRFCRLIGAEPYIAANVRSLTPQDFTQWVEYCNAPPGRTTLSDLRASGGDPQPFGVKYWGVGNESWGCGGNFTPEEYAAEFRRFTAWVPDYGIRLCFIGSGPSGGDTDWTRRFLARLTERDKGLLDLLYGWGMHYYCGTAGKGQAIDFTVDEFYELLEKANRMEELINRQWAAMAEVDTQHRVKLVVDEWGAWHRSGTEAAPAFLFGQTSTIRDALIAALTLDTFNRHADKLAMANVAQLINNLHSLFLAHEDRFAATTNFHVFEMYAAHAGGQSLRAVFSAPAVGAHAGRPAALPGLAGSASLKDKDLVLTVVNLDAGQSREAEIIIRGAAIQSGSVRVLKADDIRAHNDLTNPHMVEPSGSAIGPRGRALVHSFPAASVTCLRLRLS
jgi:alpha-N-arabinofuranosidase